MDSPSDRKLPVTLRGRFWLPDSAIVLSGELTISPPHHFDVTADVPHDSLGNVGYWESLIGTTIPIIFGLTAKGERVTLGDCGITSSKTTYGGPNSPSWHTLRFYANRVLAGAHIADLQTVRFKKFSAYFSGFSGWVADYNSALFDDAPTLQGGVKRSDQIQNVGHLSIACAGITENHLGSDVGEKRTVRYWRPTFELTEPLTFRGVTDAIITFQRLLSLLIGGPVGFDDIRAVPSDGDSAVELMAMMGGYKERFERMRSVDMLLSLPDLTENWPTTVSKWFTEYPKLAAALNLYFAVVFGNHLFEEHKLLFLAQALEGYHRCTHDDEHSKNVFSKSEWNRRKQAVLESVPTAELQWLTNELKYAPKISLAQRLSELTQPILSPLSHFIADVPKFCNDVKRLRNRLTHPKKSGAMTKGDQEALPVLWRQSRTLFEICLLRDLGVDETILNRVGKQHQHRA